MKLESNIIDPYIGQKAEGKIINFESKKSIQKKELKVFKFKSKNQYIKIYTKEFIAVCPFSGLSDIAKITIEYYPTGELALELKVKSVPTFYLFHEKQLIDSTSGSDILAVHKLIKDNLNKVEEK